MGVKSLIVEITPDISIADALFSTLKSINRLTTIGLDCRNATTTSRGDDLVFCMVMAMR